MFEFAISQHERRRPTGRSIISWIISTLAHAAALLVLIENPSLLRTGKHNWIRLPALFDTTPRDTNWRLLTHVVKSGPMQMPSAQTLKKSLYSWQAPSAPLRSPPIRVRWGDEADASKGNTKMPVPLVRPSPGTQEPKPLPDIQAASRTQSSEAKSEGGGKDAEGAKNSIPAATPGAETSSEKKAIVNLPAPETAQPRQIPKKVTERAEGSEPGTNPAPAAGASIPGQKASSPSQAKDQARVFADQKAALRTEGSGLFDTKGFPLGEYARIIIERIKGNWFIPSNLRQSQGKSTLIFFIEKDGSVSNLRVVNSSGSQSLDLAALSAVLGSKPLPPLPGGFPGEHVGAKFVFSYNEP